MVDLLVWSSTLAFIYTTLYILIWYSRPLVRALIEAMNRFMEWNG